MTAGNWIITNNARLRIAKGTFPVDTGVFRCALFLSASNIGPSSTTYAGVSNQHAQQFGYTTGGELVDFAFTGTTTISIAFTGGNPAWVANGGPIVCRYAVLYEVGGDVLAYSLLDETPDDITVPDGFQFVIDSDGTPNPALTLSGAAS